MTRLQKKCLIAAAGTHLLVVVAVLCSGFVRPKVAVDNTPILTLLSLPTTDKPTSGESTPVTPSPAVAPTPPPPIPPTPAVKPPEPQPDPPKVEVQPIVKPPEVKEPDRTEPDDPKSDVPKPPPKPKRARVKDVDISTVVTRPVPQVRDTSEEDAKDKAEAAKEAKRLLDQKRRAFANAVSTLNEKFSTATTVHLVGNSGASFANYGSFVVSVYHQRWVSPSHMNGDSAGVTFSVTIARDGRVVSSHIDNPSGDTSVDSAVQRMLDHVSFIRPFPEDSTDQERTFTIDFNATRTTQ